MTGALDLHTAYRFARTIYNVKTPLLKIDGQGFECHTMDSMGTVQEHIRAIGTEIAQRWLVGQGCSDAGTWTGCVPLASMFTSVLTT
jgi:hypothetical protein